MKEKKYIRDYQKPIMKQQKEIGQLIRSGVMNLQIVRIWLNC